MKLSFKKLNKGDSFIAVLIAKSDRHLVFSIWVMLR